MKKILLLAPIVYLLANTALFAQVSNIVIHDKELDATILVGGVYSADLKVIFENVLGLNETALTITAVQVTSSDLLNRLTEPSFINLVGGFPVMLSINPAAGSTLSFTGEVTIELHTTNLLFNSYLRFFSAPTAGVFEDITNFSGSGSYRVNGTKGRFCDFLIVSDVRDTNFVIQSKFDKLQQTLDANASLIQASMLQTLQSQITAARNAFQGGSKPDAVSNLNAMINTIQADNGNSIPNIYRADDATVINVAGELRSRADTLIFSLKL